VKLGDFGLSKVLTIPNLRFSNSLNDKKNEELLTNSFCGSPEYMSPEMLRGEGHSLSLDLYSIGALLYEMLFGLPPFYNSIRSDMYVNIVERSIDFSQVQ
jgi:serine/threonine protein kinase